MTLIAIGFFFGSELIFGLFAVSIVENVERRLETLEDVIANNISLVFQHPREKKIFKNMPIKWVQQEFGEDSLTNLLCYKNESVPSSLAMLGIDFPERITVDSQVQARMSSIKHAYSTEFQWCMPTNCPWFHHLEHNLFRFEECGLYSIPKIGMIKEELNLKSIFRPIEQSALKIREDAETEIQELDYLWLLIVVQLVVPLTVLALEIVYHKLKNIRFFTNPHPRG